MMHGNAHTCAYCRLHTFSYGGVVPSTSNMRWIAMYNLLDILQKLSIKAAEMNHNDILASDIYVTHD